MRSGIPLLICGCLLAPACRRAQQSAACSAGALAPIHPPVAIDQQGSVLEARVAVIGTNFVVVWTASTDGGSDLFARSVDVDGVPRGNVGRLTNILSSKAHPRLAVGQGGLGVAWQDNRLGRDDAFGAVVGSAFTPVLGQVFLAPTFSASQEPAPAIAAVGSSFELVWNGLGPDQNYHLYAQGMSRLGDPVGSPTPLVPDLADRASGPSLDSAGDGFLATDSESRVGTLTPPNVYTYLVEGSAAVSTEEFAPVSQAYEPEVADDAGTAGVVWCDARLNGPTDRALFFGAFDGSGITQPQALVVQTPADSCDPSIVAGDGFFVTTWNETSAGSRQVALTAVTEQGAPDAFQTTLFNDSVASSAAATLARPTVAWNGSQAGVSWVSAGHAWFEGLECTVGNFATPSGTPTPQPTPD